MGNGKRIGVSLRKTRVMRGKIEESRWGPRNSQGTGRGQESVTRRLLACLSFFLPARDMMALPCHVRISYVLFFVAVRHEECHYPRLTPISLAPKCGYGSTPRPLNSQPIHRLLRRGWEDRSWVPCMARRKAGGASGFSVSPGPAKIENFRSVRVKKFTKNMAEAADQIVISRSTP
jgi:hypothetical protein